ncbi:MAG: hypothetical protein GYA24_13405 [Candidatus Lokiarchaeota archaeon]|nr:hypothetical protein [Candidatus Lokiarchaeota archaeon]
MVRHMNKAELQKRIAIAIEKARNPAIGYRALARAHATSLRVVCDAMTRSIAEWREALADLEPECPPVATRLPITTRRPLRDASNERNCDASFDPERDLDVDELRGYGDG